MDNLHIRDSLKLEQFRTARCLCRRLARGGGGVANGAVIKSKL